MRKSMMGLVFCIVGVLLFSHTIYAQTTATNTAQVDRVGMLRIKLLNELNRRLTHLSSFILRVGNSNLSTSDKDSLLSQLQGMINETTDLRTKVEAETALSGIRDYSNKITSSYRNFALTRPKTGLLVASDQILKHADKVATVSAKLQVKVTEASASGRDVNALQSKLTDTNSKVTLARAYVKDAKAMIISLTTVGFPANKSQLEQALKLLNSARDSLQMARLYLKDINQALKLTQ